MAIAKGNCGLVRRQARPFEPGKLQPLVEVFFADDGLSEAHLNGVLANITLAHIYIVGGRHPRRRVSVANDTTRL